MSLGLAFDFGKNQTAGDASTRSYGTESGDMRVNGTLYAYNIEVSGNITIATSSIVDVFAGTIYTFGDPVMLLNANATTDYVGLNPPYYSGLEIDRGDTLTYPNAVLVYSELATHIGYWRMGYKGDVVANMQRVVGLDPTVSDGSGNYVIWDATGGRAISIAGMSMQTTRTIFNRPLQLEQPLASTEDSFFASRAFRTSLLSIRKLDSGGVETERVSLGWNNETIFGSTVNNVPGIRANGRLYFKSDLSGQDDIFIFGDALTIGTSGITGIVRGQQ